MNCTGEASGTSRQLICQHSSAGTQRLDGGLLIVYLSSRYGIKVATRAAFQLMRMHHDSCARRLDDSIPQHPNTPNTHPYKPLDPFLSFWDLSCLEKC